MDVHGTCDFGPGKLTLSQMLPTCISRDENILYKPRDLARSWLGKLVGHPHALMKMRSFWLLFLGLLAGLVASGGIHRNFTSIKASYDYVIAGGGLAGLVVANRLTEDANSENPSLCLNSPVSDECSIATVLVVEYGDFDDTWNTAIPYYGGMLQSDSLMLRTQYGPQKYLNNRNFTLAQGAVVGGGTTVNGMVLTRGGRLDYDVWDLLIGPGPIRWGWDDLLPYFKKVSLFGTLLCRDWRFYLKL